MDNKPSTHQEQVTEEEIVFKPQGTEMYRIPALFYDKDSDKLLAFAEKRKNENDTSTEELVMKTGTMTRDPTTQAVKITWSELRTLVKKADPQGDYNNFRPMNPCPVYDKTSKTLYLFFIRVEDEVSEQQQIDTKTNKARLCYITTTDAGQSWNERNPDDKLPEIKGWSTFALGPGHGLQTKSGRLIVPAYAYIPYCSSYCGSSFCCNSCFCSSCCCSSFCNSSCYFCYFKSKAAPYALTLYKDQSTNWKFGKLLPNESIECQMAEFVDEQDMSFIYCNARTKGGFREEAVSENNGEDFSNLIGHPKLAETKKYGGCQGSVVSFPAQNEGASQSQNKWLLYTHPSDQSERIDMAVYLNKSPKKPNAWRGPWIIRKGPCAYSDLAYIGNGWFACLMECGEEKYTEQIALKMFHYNYVKQGIGE